MWIAAGVFGLEELLTLGGYLGSYAEFWIWLTLAMGIAEIFTSGFFLGALAVGSMLTALAAWLGVGPEWQIGTFSLTSILAMVLIRPVFMKLLRGPDVVTGADALVGKAGTVVAQIPAGAVGRVRLANEEWRATAQTSLDVGDAVTVLGVEGNTLRVSGPSTSSAS